MNKKEIYINNVFTTIARDYNRMNTVISLGTHNFFKAKAVKKLQVKNRDIVLDLAAGTGDITGRIGKISSAKAIMADMNAEMLKISKQRFPDNDAVVCDAANLPFLANTFDKVIIGFGIRNFTRLEKSFENVYRVMNPGGKFVILEFAQPPSKFVRFFRNIYFRKIIPAISQILINKKQEYHYLASSIINFHNQEKIINILENQSFRKCEYRNYLFGGIAIYSCEK
ncbi:MAG: ubiquinone/menaquinone biosynthesis methyltransferase [Candidatus Marinimicrobia bacterium]|nr:ubiquinone/menaquinone biosynthesis methyltransferase [Candidatus Neomarinimicrobiota bacterium]